MTPEELNRKIEFIIESQARLAAAQEQDREDRIKFEEWSKNLDARVIRLTEHQSRRMDDLDKTYADWTRRHAEFEQRTFAFHDELLDMQRQALRLLNLILDRLPPAPPNPN